jgi:hypothetical protein
MRLSIVWLIITVLISGCATIWEMTVNDYCAAAPRVELGMSKQQVLEILAPTQRRLTNTEIKQPDRYIKEGVNVEILYFRSGWQPDGLTTDDEFTPYLFNDGKLVAIGWASIGGPKSQGQASPTTNVIIQNRTIVY